MGHLKQLVATILTERRVTDEQVTQVRAALHSDGRLDLDDVRALVEIYCECGDRAPAFDALFFSVLERVLLGDGRIEPAEQFYLLKMLYSDREIREPELAFLRKLQKTVRGRSPEFDQLVETALSADRVAWSVGGR